MRPHYSLDVWKRSVDFAETIYRLTANFPRAEEYGLKSQLRRAAVSIPCNIAEGAARQTKKEFVQFLYIAAGSASEVDTQLEIAVRLGYVDRNRKGVIGGDLENISKMISGLVRSIRTKRS